MNANEKHAELGYRTLLVHAQKIGAGSSANDVEPVIVDLLTSLMHLEREYNFRIDDLLQQAKIRFEDEKSAVAVRPTISQEEIDTLLDEGDSLHIEEVAAAFGANWKYVREGVWSLDGVESDINRVRELLERHVTPAPVMV